MKLHTLLLVSACGLTGVAQAAVTNPVPTANCALTSAENLGGKVVTLNLNDEGGAKVSLPFAPLSAYVATGYAIKVFAKPSFVGAGLMLGGGVLDYGEQVQGGRYFALQQWSTFGDVESAACVKAGERFPDHDNGLVFYNDRNFSINGYRSNGLYAAITFKNGKKLVEYFNGGSSRYGSNQAVTGSYDLDSGDITLHSPNSDVVYHRPAQVGVNSVESMTYAGAAAALAQDIEGVVANATNWPPQAYSVPYLELQPVIKHLRQFASF